MRRREAGIGVAPWAQAVPHGASAAAPTCCVVNWERAGREGSAWTDIDARAHYQVRQGDTLLALARAYLLRPGDVVAVRRANHVHNSRRLRIGSVLTIPVAWLKTAPIDAAVEAVGGVVVVTSQGRRSALTKDMTLHEGDVVSTGANAFVRMVLPDKTHVSLPSQSRLRLQHLRRVLLTGALDRDFSLESGRVESEVTPMRQPQDHFLVRTPLSIAAVRGTVLRVSFDPGARRAGVGVLKGVVGVASPKDEGAEIKVPKSFGVVADAAGISAVRALLPAPTLKADSALQQGAQVSLEVEPMAGAAAYRAALAPDAGVIAPFTEIVSDQPKLSLAALPDGEWFVRLTAIDADGLEGAQSIYGFDRVLNSLNLGAPAHYGKKRRAHWLFKWESQSAGKPSYRFQLFADIEGSPPIIDEGGLDRSQITVTDLLPGGYHWRVESSLTRDGHSYNAWSVMGQFRILR